MSTQQELKLKGNTYFQNGDFKKAIEFYTLAIEKDAFCDEAAPILSNRSLCYYNLKKYKEAYEDAGCCCGIRPDWAKGFARRGAAAEQLKEWQIALESYDEYLRLDQSDEMSIGIKRSNVKKIVDDIARSNEKRAEELRSLDKQLSEMTKPTLKKGNNVYASPQVYAVLLDGCREMTIEKIELAVKYADLSQPYAKQDYLQRYLGLPPNKNEGYSLTVRWQFGERTPPFVQDSPLEILEMAEHELTEDEYTENLACSAATALAPLKRNVSDPRLSDFDATTLLVKQRNFLDRLLDVVNDQKKQYTPRKMMYLELFSVCSYDEVRPIRKDLVLVLLEKGKKFFIGEKESDRDWRRLLLSAVLSGVMTVRPRSQYRFDDYAKVLSDATPAVSRSIHECVQLLLEGLSSKDLDEIPKCVVVQNGPGFLRMLPLQAAIIHGHRSSVVKLILDAGASANENALFPSGPSETNLHRLERGERRGYMGLLERAFNTNIPENARMLLKNGAQFSSEKFPTWATELIGLEQAKFPSTQFVDIHDKQSENFQSIISTLNSKSFKLMKDATASEETIRLLCDTLTDQKIGLYFTSDSDCKTSYICHTPLTRAISSGFPVAFMRTLVKVRPKLANSPSFNKHKNGKLFVLHPIGALIESTMVEDDTSEQHVIEVAKLLYEEGDLNYYTSLARRLTNDWGFTHEHSAEKFLHLMKENVHPQSRTVRVLTALDKFCVGYENARSGSDKGKNK